MSEPKTKLQEAHEAIDAIYSPTSTEAIVSAAHAALNAVVEEARDHQSTLERDERDSLIAKLAAEKARADELEALFDLQHTRTMKADKAWREAHPGNDLVRPDLGVLIEWLMARADALDNKAREGFAAAIHERERADAAERERDKQALSVDTLLRDIERLEQSLSERTRARDEARADFARVVMEHDKCREEPANG